MSPWNYPPYDINVQLITKTWRVGETPCGEVQQTDKILTDNVLPAQNRTGSASHVERGGHALLMIPDKNETSVQFFHSFLTASYSVMPHDE